MDLTDIGSLATAVGVTFAAWQIAAQRTQTRTAFQDALWREQREIIGAMPVDLVLMKEGDAFDPATLSDRERGLMYRYFDLCNEQAMFAAVGRIGPNTWYTWCGSIVHNMRRPAFAHAWQMLGSGRAAEEFRHLSDVLSGAHRLSWRRDPLGAIFRRGRRTTR